MKNIVLFLSLYFICQTLTAQQQPWAPLGAHWYYCQGTGLGEPICGGYFYQEVEKDTVVAGRACRKISGYQKNWQGIVTPLPPEFSYMQHDSVYYYNPDFGYFQLRYDFRAHPGDTLMFPAPMILPWSPADSNFQVRVDSITLLQTGAVTLRVFHVTTIAGPIGNIAWVFPGNYYMERIGGAMLNTPSPSATIPEIDGFIRCYADQDVFHQFSPEACDYVESGWFGNAPVWHYEYSSWGQSGFEKMEMDPGMYYVQGALCNKILKTAYTHNPAGGTYVYPQAPRYVYDVDDRVYVLHDSVFEKMYDFNLSIGQSLQFAIPECNSALTYVIDSSGVMSIKGVNLRFQKVHISDYSETWLIGLKLLIVERIGPIMLDYNLPGNPGFQPGGYFFLDEAFICFTDQPYLGFRCYSDAEIPEYNITPKACDFIVGATEPGIGLDVKVNPNPVNNVLNINFADVQNTWNYQIFNLLGQCVALGRSKPEERQIEVSDLVPGLYLLEISKAGKRGIVKFVKE